MEGVITVALLAGGAGGIGLALGLADIPIGIGFGLVLAIAVLAGAIMERRNEPKRVISLEGWRAFRRELHRARRRGVPVALVRFPAASDGDRGVLHRRLEAARRSLRRIDVVWAHGDDVIVLLPETGHAAAREVVARVARTRASLFADATAVVAAFPDDGLTSTAVVAALRGSPVAVVEPPARPVILQPDARLALPATVAAGSSALPPAPAAAPVIAAFGGEPATPGMTSGVSMSLDGATGGAEAAS
jgi:hypothetical protein